MTDALERLLSLKVADLARRDVVTVAAHDGMPCAAATLLAHEVSGAPVVDAQGRLVGMLSAVDFLRRARSDASESVCAGERDLGRAAEDLPLAVEPLPHDFVSRYMSPSVQSIAGDAALLQAAQIMSAAHIHRLAVVDASGRPCGMITSLDVVAALFNACEEQRAGPRAGTAAAVTLSSPT